MTYGGGRGKIGRRVDPDDRAQLDRAPVPLRRVTALFRPYTRQVLAVVVLIVAASVISLASPFLLRAVIDDALPHHDLRLLLWAVGGMIAIAGVTSLIGVVQTWLSTTVGQRVMHGLRTAVFTHLQRQSLAFFTRTRGGEVQSRMTRAVTIEQQRHLADMSAQVEEGLSISGALLSKTVGAGEVQAERFARTSDELVDLEVRSQLAGRWLMGTMTVVFAAIPALI